jgi:uncharacterized protein YmfQ (DUF2313 family)
MPLSAIVSHSTAAAPTSERALYIYRWSRYLGLPICDGTRKGMACRVLIRGKRNSALVEFSDGFRAITSRNALKKVHPQAR